MTTYMGRSAFANLKALKSDVVSLDTEVADLRKALAKSNATIAELQRALRRLSPPGAIMSASPESEEAEELARHRRWRESQANAAVRNFRAAREDRWSQR